MNFKYLVGSLKCLIGRHDFQTEEEHKGTDGVGQNYHQKLLRCSRCEKTNFWWTILPNSGEKTQ